MNKKPCIVLFDIETSPNQAYTWGKYDQNVIAFKKEWELLSFAYKKLGDKKTNVISRRNFKDNNEKGLVRSLWAILNAADVVIAHNGDEFDIKKAYAKFIEHGFRPPSPFQKIDTKKLAKRYFNFNSNSLDDLGNLLKVGRKEKTGGFDLWLDCMAGKAAAWKRMENYNKKDVELLERIYLKLRPYAETGPNIGFMMGKTKACPRCGSNRVSPNGIRTTNTTQYQRYRCFDCGSVSKGRSTLKVSKPEVV